MSQTTSTFPQSFNTPAASPDFKQLVFADLQQIRQGLNQIGQDKTALFQTSVLHSVLHIALDWAWVFAALWAVTQWGWAVPVSLLVIGNRQRALGNTLAFAPATCWVNKPLFAPD